MSDVVDEAVETPVVFEPLPLLYEDPWLAVVNKPAGLMVHDSKQAQLFKSRSAIQCLFQ